MRGLIGIAIGKGDKRLSAGIVDIIRSSVWVLVMGREKTERGSWLARRDGGDGVEWLGRAESLSEAAEQPEADKCGGNCPGRA